MEAVLTAESALTAWRETTAGLLVMAVFNMLTTAMIVVFCFSGVRDFVIFLSDNITREPIETFGFVQ